MQVKIRVLVGKNTGKEIAIDQKEFLIGRGDACHLRPKTDTVSRQHCAILVQDGKVVLRDLGSKNGTFVNGERLAGERVLKDGDEVKAGKLEFSMVIEQPAEAKRAAAPKVKEVAARNIGRRADGGQFEDDDVSDWLTEGDTDERKRVADPETRQFRLDETDQITLSRAPAPKSDPAVPTAAAEHETVARHETVAAVPESETKAEGGKKEKREPGKLPKIPQNQSQDSRQAAEQMLKKFFNRR